MKTLSLLDFRPQFKLYVNTNYLPVITDMTVFSSNRVLIIPFDRHFEEWEQDKTLKAEFRKPEVKSAILNWLLDGYYLLMDEGFGSAVLVIITSLVGIFAIAAALNGHIIRKITVIEKVLLVAGGLTLLIPGLTTDIIGFVLVAVVILLQYFVKMNTAKSKES